MPTTDTAPDPEDNNGDKHATHTSTAAMYAIRIDLRGTRREIAVPSDMTFNDLHRLIQYAMCWNDAHLHEFDIPNRRIVITDPEFETDDYDEKVVSEYDALISEYVGQRISYVYDFGDWWDHRITIEECDDLESDVAVMTVCKGGPFIEDSGGENEEWSKKDCEKFMSEANEYLKGWKPSVSTDPPKPRLPYWASVPLSLALILPNEPLLLDPESGGVYSRRRSKYFPIARKEDAARMMVIPRNLRIDVRELTRLIIERFGSEADTDEPLIPPASGDPEKAYQEMGEWLLCNTMFYCVKSSYEIAESMGFSMDPVDFMDDYTKYFEEYMPYMLMPFRALCPHCYGRLANPVPIEETGYIRVCYFKTKRLTMECVECGRHTTLCRSLPLEDDKFSYEKPYIPLSIINNLKHMKDPHKDMEGANQCLSILLLLYGLDRQAAEVVERLAECKNAARIATYTSVLAACGLIGPDEVAKKLKSMQFGGNIYFEAMCILCTLNEVWDLGDERFDQETLEKLLENPNEETVRQTKTILARILRRYGKAEKAASLAYESVMDMYDRTGWRALDEYCRSARAAGIALDLSVIPAGLKARTNGVDDYLFDAIYYRKGAMHLMDGDRKTATAMMRRIVGDVLTGMNADPRLLARASVAALYLHLEGVRYSNKNLVSYSVKWMCSAYKAGLASDEEFVEYLRRLIPLVREDEDAGSITKMLKKNGFEGYELPADTIEDADIEDFFDMDFQYSYI